MDKERLSEHVASTYRNLRFGLAGIGFTFPLFLYFIGKVWYGISLQDSMSAYYFAPVPEAGSALRSWLTSIDFPPIAYILGVLAELDGDAPMRIWFVGFLFVLGALLYLYKGFTDLENVWLNVAGFFALLVALFPMEWNCVDGCRRFTVHGAAALFAFVCIAVVAIWCAEDSLADLPEGSRSQNSYTLPDNWVARLFAPLTIGLIDGLARLIAPLINWWRAIRHYKEPFPIGSRRRVYRNRYYVTSILMVIFPLIAFVLTSLANRQTQFVFAMEALGLWSFAAYWFIKSLELEESQAEIRAIAEESAIPSGVAKQAGDNFTQDTPATPSPVS